MTKKELKYLIYTDVVRSIGEYNKKHLLKVIISDKNPGLKYCVIFRLCKYYEENNSKIINKFIKKFLVNKLRKLQIKYGIEIYHKTDIKEGLLINHFGGIVFHSNAKIGKNFTVLQDVTIGNNLFKSRDEVAIIGDNVTVGAGAKIIGNINIGNNVTIGANAVVTKDIPDGAIVAGNPARIISYKEPIVLNTNYLSREDFINN